MNRPLRTLVVGFGKMSSKYANDPVMARHYRYATHAQVLVANPKFEWVAVVDPDEAARDDAKIHWGISAVEKNIANLGSFASEIEVAVLATPPEARLGIIEALPNLRAILVEKPLGRSLNDSAEFLRNCRMRNIQVHVNFWRRADQQFQHLSHGGLKDIVGKTQIAHGVYGNGVLNNGIHLIDFIRMLLGEVESVAPLGKQPTFVEGPIAGDMNFPFVLNLINGMVVPIQPIRFASYREVGLEIWGENGHLSILNEGLTIAHRQRHPNRGMACEHEIAFDEANYLKSTVGEALFRMYDDLALALYTKSKPCSPGDSALQTSIVVEAVLESFRRKKMTHINEYIEEAV
ncbi:Oxidoreductase family, NAD-binding Rossmann fold [Legionella lansingensis]|uniref:Inositol 2-dehydrogenase/D-chiro-inositol 3-dehydrogenase n=1 Tax=Legionella lansingensis TaxID=45067 RepID=A0A0W0VVZ5_9GAMM|nr:Gfo/Idh/MocA family oxidoreductase [Legionella lansingensis]KTD24316.1 Inositol 2-dehydrogenase/D-chiro-inositol 3-dehydrogenase [Legionella lansingensis]SNV51816.1 Oxidoreductase family, NAD-binding Rossmann fold [Legionella lansingensis]